MSKVKALYHIVFATKHRADTINQENSEALYRYIWSVIQASNCTLYRIGGIENHIHLLINLHPSVALSTLVRDIKSRSSSWIKQSGFFPKFSGWAAEYFAGTISWSNKDAVIEYIKSQREHHSSNNITDELQGLIKGIGEEYYENDLT